MKKLVLLLCLLVPAATYAASQAQNDEVPREIVAWIESEVAKSDTPSVTNLHSAREFFGNEKNARLVGYIKGYDPQAGFTVGQISHHNMITGENLVSVIEIEPDGRFTSDVEIVTPACPYILINHRYVDLYLEPGQTLGVVLNYADFLKPERNMRPAAFYGSLATVNEEFNEYKIPTKTGGMANPPADVFKKYIIGCWKLHSDKLDELLGANSVSPKSADILRSRIITVHTNALFDFFSTMRYQNQKDPDIDRKMDSIKRTGYYDFLQQTPLNDPALLIDYNSYFLINRYEYADHQVNILNQFMNPKPAKSFYEYLTDELGVNDLSQEEAAHFKRDLTAEILNLKNGEKLRELVEEYNEKNKEFTKRFENEKADYDKKYTPIRPSWLEILKKELQLKDSTLKNIFRIKPNLVQDIAEIHVLKNKIDQLSKEEAREAVDYMQFGFANPFMAAWAERIYNEKFPSGGVADEAYELPQGKATDIFKRIIDPFRGKLLIVDFWGTTCGPCVSEIEHSKTVREGYKDDDRIAFVYITNEGNSPQAAAYDKFVAENFMPNSYRLSTNEWNYLTQLFQVSGIPHQTLITPDGRVAEKRFRPESAKHYLDALIAKYFPVE